MKKANKKNKSNVNFFKFKSFQKIIKNKFKQKNN